MVYLHYQPGINNDNAYWNSDWDACGIVENGVFKVNTLERDLQDTPWNFADKALSLVYLACICKDLIFGGFVCIDDLLKDVSVKYILRETYKIAKKHNLPWDRFEFVPETSKHYKKEHCMFHGMPKGIAKIIDTGNIMMTGYPIEEQLTAEDFLFKYSVRDILEHSNVGIAFTGRKYY